MAQGSYYPLQALGEFGNEWGQRREYMEGMYVQWTESGPKEGM